MILQLFQACFMHKYGKKMIFEELHRAGERQRSQISWSVAWIAGGEKEPQSLMPGSRSLGVSVGRQR